MNKRENPILVVLDFIECINTGDSKRLVDLQTKDFTLIDIDGNRFVGKDDWKSYFTENPDYRIHIHNILLSGDSVAIIGKTTGSHVDSQTEILETVLWIADVRNGQVSFWRIYSDINEILSKFQKPSK